MRGLIPWSPLLFGPTLLDVLDSLPMLPESLLELEPFDLGPEPVVRCNDEEISVELEIPKEEAERANVSIEDNFLRIEVCREKKEGGVLTIRSIEQVQLPKGAIESEAKAVYENGVLKVVVPRSKAEPPKKIQVEVK